jgi:hypothetical protein
MRFSRVKFERGLAQTMAWKQTKFQLYYLTLSMLGLVLLAFTVFKYDFSQEKIPYQTEIIGSVFVAICLFGIVAGVYPKVFSNSRARVSSDSKFQGHHPVCDHYSNHVIHWNERVFCAGCSGLVIGAGLAILYSILYLGFGVFLGVPVTVFWFSFLLVFIGLIQHFIDMGNPIIHFLLNLVFVLGSSMLLFSLDALGVNIRIMSYLLALIVFWIITRIRLSQFDHVKICVLCGLDCVDSFS